MNASAVLERLRERGVKAVVEGERLFLEPADRVPADLLVAAREVKTDLIEFASGRPDQTVVPNRDGTAAERAAYRGRDERLRAEVAVDLRDLLRRLTRLHERMKEKFPAQDGSGNAEAFTICLGRYENGERLLRVLFGYEGCLWGPDKTCPPDQPVACEFCSDPSDKWNDW